MLHMTMLLASAAAPSTLTVGDRRGRVRDASNDAGWPAVSCDTCACESERPGVSYQGDVRDVGHLTCWRRVLAFMPCEQQTWSLGALAVDKALDGRMWWGCAAWLWVWCLPARCLLSEQPDVYF